MTLPQLMTFAVQARSGSDTARYIFPLGKWSIEAAANLRSLIVCLRTEDGFEVAFSIPLEMCNSLAWAIRRDAQLAATMAADADGTRVGKVAAEPAELRQAPAKVKYPH
jgi:hypothetical protein